MDTWSSPRLRGRGPERGRKDQSGNGRGSVGTRCNATLQIKLFGYANSIETTFPLYHIVQGLMAISMHLSIHGYEDRKCLNS